MVDVCSSHGLGERGSSLFNALAECFDGDSSRLALLVEACRIADRLDGLNEAVSARGVIDLMRFRSMLGSGNGSEESPIKVEIKFDSVLAEARQQANTLRLILGQIVPADVGKQGAEAGDGAADGPKGGLSIDQLADRRQQRASSANRHQAAE